MAKGRWDKLNKQIKSSTYGTAMWGRVKRPFMSKFVCYNRPLPGWRYRLGVRTEDSQSSNTGSIPVSATNYLPLRPAKSAGFVFAREVCWHSLA